MYSATYVTQFTQLYIQTFLHCKKKTNNIYLTTRKSRIILLNKKVHLLHIPGQTVRRKRPCGRKTIIFIVSKTTIQL